MELEGIDHVALAVRDVEAAAKWYIDVLGFERRYDDVWNGYPVFVMKGNTGLALFPADQARSTSLAAVALPARRSLTEAGAKEASSRREIGMRHLAFRATRKNFLIAQEELKRRGIEFEFQDHEISHSIYFYDPDGHELEITTYEVK
jgi:catechol 2,3-dioxygenase-like lactoylglutathione lyase family enzyme